MATSQRSNDTQQEYLSIRDASRVIPSRPHSATVWRWMLKGVRGIRLASTLIGGRRYVTRQGIEDFLDALNAESRISVPRLSLARERAIAAAERELDELGV